MTNNILKLQIKQKILDNFSLSEKQRDLLDRCFVDEINLPRLDNVIDVMIEYRMGADILIPYILFQCYKTNETLAMSLLGSDLTTQEIKLFETFVTVKDVRSFSRSGEDRKSVV